MIYSKERRAEVLRECDAGRGTREVAAFFGVSESRVRRAKQERRETGKVAPKPTRDRKPSWAPHAGRLRDEVAARPDATLRELTAAAGDRGRAVGKSTLARALRAPGLTRKKRRSCPPGRPAPMSPTPAATGSRS